MGLLGLSPFDSDGFGIVQLAAGWTRQAVSATDVWTTGSEDSVGLRSQCEGARVGEAAGCDPCGVLFLGKARRPAVSLTRLMICGTRQGVAQLSVYLPLDSRERTLRSELNLARARVFKRRG